jgi:hypothetical protein
MSPDKFNVDIPDLVVTQILDLLNQVETKLAPFEVALPDDEQKHLPKISDESIPFAQKTNGYMDTDPAYNPAFVNVTETHKDFKNFTKVNPIYAKLSGLRNKVSKIQIASGSDAMIQFLGYYNSVRQASKNGVPGAKVIYDDLALRFPGHKKVTPPTP